ncbi:MAG TPA: phytanoyl-CoA dioxygenase family protein [Burkholderiales bacterium]|nr:phytanoyl-CoA dioxygenase family protein [Burkholderiales bacterium]
MPKHLTDEQLAQFQDEGYAFPFRAVSARQAAGYRRRIEAYEARVRHDANRTLKIKGNLAFPWLMELGRNPAILDAVEDVIGPNLLLFGASIFAKNARDPHYVSWHQDSAYFGLDPHEEVTAWVGFTESTIEKGCLKVMPRTHLGPDLHHVETHAPDNMLAKGQSIAGLDEKQAVHLELKPGEFSLHHERMAHASEPNRGADRRIGFAFFYIPTHVRSTIGRRQATLVRGIDEHGHWDPDQEPRFDLDPLAMKQLTAAWGQYKDGEIRQAADTAVE